ncbi:MAG: hypothetical protein Q9218_007445 [Villophora microphyllina]
MPIPLVRSRLLHNKPIFFLAQTSSKPLALPSIHLLPASSALLYHLIICDIKYHLYVYLSGKMPYSPLCALITGLTAAIVGLFVVVQQTGLVPVSGFGPRSSLFSAPFPSPTTATVQVKLDDHVFFSSFGASEMLGNLSVNASSPSPSVLSSFDITKLPVNTSSPSLNESLTESPIIRALPVIAAANFTTTSKPSSSTAPASPPVKIIYPGFFAHLRWFLLRWVELVLSCIAMVSLHSSNLINRFPPIEPRKPAVVVMKKPTDEQHSEAQVLAHYGVEKRRHNGKAGVRFPGTNCVNPSALIIPLPDSPPSSPTLPMPVNTPWAPPSTTTRSPPPSPGTPPATPVIPDSTSPPPSPIITFPPPSPGLSSPSPSPAPAIAPSIPVNSSPAPPTPSSPKPSPLPVNTSSVPPTRISQPTNFRATAPAFIPNPRAAAWPSTLTPSQFAAKYPMHGKKSEK